MRNTGVVLLLATAFCGYVAYRWVYPYGARPCCLPCVLQSLRSYADQNQENFPDNVENPLDALRKLYPDFLKDGRLLAGISGDRKKTKENLISSKPLNQEVCSWIYWSGFSITNDPSIAILWEREEGISFNGKRAPGRAVGFLNGTTRQIPAEQWDAFLRDQEKLRKATLRTNMMASSLNRIER